MRNIPNLPEILRTGGLSVALVTASLAASSCQNYNANPVQAGAVVAAKRLFTIKGKELAPNLMLVVDKSFSMTVSADGTGAPCASGGVFQPGSPAPCKWKDLLNAFVRDRGFLDEVDAVARIGLVTFPTGESCGAGQIQVAVGEKHAPAIKEALRATRPGGQTPTAATMDVVLQDPAMANPDGGRRRYVMLLTDGAPNCSASLKPRCDLCQSQPATCATTDGCQPTFNGPGCVDATVCLDETATIDSVTRLHAQGIITLVVGFGQDTVTPFASRVLNELSQAGGMPLPGGDKRYYQANSGEELQKILEELRGVLQSCELSLDPPASRSQFVTVTLVDRVKNTEVELVPGTDWTFAKTEQGSEDLGHVKVVGARCQTIQEAAAGTFEISLTFINPL